MGVHIVQLARMAETPHPATHPAQIQVTILRLDLRDVVPSYPALMVIIANLVPNPVNQPRNLVQGALRVNTSNARVRVSVY